MSYYVDDHRVPPKSRAEIRRLANTIRTLSGVRYDAPFPIMRFVELVLPKMFPGFAIEVLPMSEMGNKHGETLPDRRIMRIREDIYERACRGGRDRLTVAHEVGHLLMHSGLTVAMARNVSDYPAYESSEWQANAFAGELLIPHDAVVGMRPREVAVRYKVSESAAAKQLRS